MVKKASKRKTTKRKTKKGISIPLSNKAFDPSILEKMEREGVEKWENAEKFVRKIGSKSDKKMYHKTVYALGSQVRKTANSIWGQVEASVSDYTLQNWTPQQSLVPVSRTGRPYTAAQLKSKLAPVYFHNPHQGFEQIIFADIYQFTEIGPIIQELVGYLVGEKFTPKLKLKQKPKEGESELEIIDKYQYILDELEQVDEALGSTGDDGTDIPFQEKMLMIIINTFVFNRAAGIYLYGNGLEITDKNGKLKRVQGLPTGFVDQHPRDIGVIEVEPNTWKLKSVQFATVQNKNSGFLPASDVFYLWHALYSAPIHNSRWYGTSLIAFCLEEGRTLRQLTSRNFPAYGNILSTGNPLIQLDPNGVSEEDRDAISAEMLRDFSGDGPTLLWYEMSGVVVHPLETKIPIAELVEFRKSIREASIIKARLPLSLFGSEKDTNRATLEMRVQLARRTLKPQRQWLGRVISDQHYMKMFKIIYPDPECEERQMFEIETQFDDLQIDTAEDRMERLRVLIESGYPLSIPGASKILEQPDLESEMDMEMYKEIRDQKLKEAKMDPADKVKPAPGEKREPFKKRRQEDAQQTKKDDKKESKK